MSMVGTIEDMRWEIKQQQKEIAEKVAEIKYKKGVVKPKDNFDKTLEELQNKKLFIEVEKKKYAADIILKPLKETNFKNI